MIKLYKIDEPDILAKNGGVWTQKLLQEIKSGGARRKYYEAKYRHPKIKEAICKETRNKCAYCETFVTAASFGDIEHIIPKSRCRERTFEWSNLTLSCQKCNSKKSDYYSVEHPLLNPYIDDPCAHMICVGAWISHKDDKGQITVEILNLNRAELLQNRSNKLEKIKKLKETYSEITDGKVREHLKKEMLAYSNDIEEYSFMFTEYLYAEECFG
ncbi:HNH endonuclease [Listeria booriae]|uniref:HNH endonuclease n=1 Tax=Listeria booriae TaxID=1552123 RepID=UPI00162A26B8|nr:HNH endonuclease [Listeria booriae]MBC2105559.1 HNH endonuclease [Listeria booriae]